MNRRLSIRRLEDQSSNDDLADRTPAELISMVWPLTKTAWAFKQAGSNHASDIPDAEQRLQRHIVRVRRRQG